MNLLCDVFTLFGIRNLAMHLGSTVSVAERFGPVPWSIFKLYINLCLFGPRLILSEASLFRKGAGKWEREAVYFSHVSLGDIWMVLGFPLIGRIRIVLGQLILQEAYYV